MAGVYFDPIEITKLLVFGTSTPSPDNYNEHIRLELEPGKEEAKDYPSGDKRAPSITYNMYAYMETGAGRFAYPSLFPAVKKFFNAKISDGNYTYAQITSMLGLKEGDKKPIFGPPTLGDNEIEISQYGTDINGKDHADRSYMFGQTSFTFTTEKKNLLNDISFEVKDGKKTIRNMEVRAYDDNFDYESGNFNPLITAANKELDSLLNPYKLARLPVEVKIRGNGKPYLSYSQEDFAAHQEREGDVALGKLGVNISVGVKKIAEQKDQYIAKLRTDPFLSYKRGNLSVIYGTPGKDDLSPSDAKLKSVAPFLIVGGAGDDTLSGSASDDELDGGDGSDKAVYKGTKDEYNMQSANGSQRISDSIPLRDGIDTLKNIEKIVFKKGSAQDICFVIDTTDSMSDDIDEVKTRASEIINIVLGEKSDSPDSVSPDKTNSGGSRIAVVGYNDPGTDIFLPFTDQPDIEQRKTAALNAINSISVSGGGDIPEVVNAGLIRALSGDAGKWRAEADVRRIILFGDAPPKDDELRAQVLALASASNVGNSVSASSLPSSMSIAGDINTSNIASNLAVTRFALQTDNQAKIPVEIFTILIGNDATTAADFQSLATATGGKALKAADASKIVDVIIEALGTSADGGTPSVENKTVSITTPMQNVINGSPNDDQLLGFRGNNILMGLEGNDILHGGKENDILDAGIGNDQLWGDLGQDILIGGPGNDTFFLIGNSAVLSLPEQADVITDFQPGDTIGLASGLLLDQLVFEPITLQLDGGLPSVSTAIKLGSNYLAIVQGVQTSTLTPNVFIGV